MGKNKINFTVNRLNALEPDPNKRLYIYDTTQAGLRVAVTQRGVKTFQFQKWSNKQGKPLTKSLGRIETMSITDARKMAAALLAEMNDGVDIEAKKRNEKRQYINDPTVEEFSKVYIEKYCMKKGRKSTPETQRILNHDILPQIGKIKLNEVTRADLISLIDVIEDRGAMVACNRALAVLSKMFNFAAERDILKGMPPTFGMKKRGEERVRERCLSGDEITILWHALGNSSMGMMLRFLMLTGQRLSEARLMKWKHVKGEIWTIPSANSKNKKEHLVPLSSQALKILDDAKRCSTIGNEYVFPGKSGNYAAHSSPNQLLQRVIIKLDWPRTTVHDFRRTVKTGMSKLKIKPHIKNEVLNHARDKMDQHYDKHDYLDEKAEALNKWADYIERKTIKIV
ncbi:tyrosine-type recombinase/integrase [Desulfogranum japonicum]|uniref:tyrosine-type recombinase/integrase n=1 Tax=Desulfogranum japonicum TaxID=231447 RepID=UPI0004075CB9|nr:site-specific integrase [Desulfogranum japonicum]